MRSFVILVIVAIGVWLIYKLETSSGDGGSGGAASGDNPVTALAKYGYNDLKQLWISNGGDPSKADLAAAVALGESSGNPNALNSADPNGGSAGLWQINGVHGDLDSFYDPNANAQAAIALSNDGANWNPWGAFTNGSYAQYLETGDGND